MILAPHRPPAVPIKPATGRCDLTLKINDLAYRVRRIPAEHGATRAFRLTRPDGESHEISQGPRWADCSCADYRFRRGPYDPSGCKHLKAARAVGLID